MRTDELRKKVGQLMVFGFDGITPSEKIKELISKYNVGGIILFARNIGTPEEILQLTTELQLEAKSAGHKNPLLICIDQENGIVRRLGKGTTVFPGAMLLGATQEPENAYAIGLATGKELKALGINWNLAPVVDVNNNSHNPVIGVRSYGEDPESVSVFGKAAMKGMQKAGVITALKHFPGHGDTDVDSHLDLPTISHDLERLERIELVPFRKLIDEGADTIMTAHVYFPTIERNKGIPATLSKNVITGLLRESLGFEGVVTTDCMEMNAIKNTIGTAQGAVEAIKAGVDLVMVSHSHNLQKDSIEAVVKAVETGEIEESVIDKALMRVKKLKEKYLSWSDINIDKNGLQVPDVVGCNEHMKLSQDVYRQGITIINNESNILPLSNEEKNKVFVVYPINSKMVQVEDIQYSNCSLGEVIQEIHPTAQYEKLSNPPADEEIQGIMKKVMEYDTIIVGTLSAVHGSQQTKLVEALYETGKPIIVVSMRSPYDIAVLPKVSACIATYEFTYPALKMAAKAIYGLEKVNGTLPVTIPTIK